mmetsp:Transcript_53284/g.125009  ORF Transcript_53284/g.125009 Transcript_53284/m.125009 type:complete len:325 (+) Transcript_53284:3318-4292(+)
MPSVYLTEPGKASLGLLPDPGRQQPQHQPEQTTDDVGRDRCRTHPRSRHQRLADQHRGEAGKSRTDRKARLFQQICPSIEHLEPGFCIALAKQQRQLDGPFVHLVLGKGAQHLQRLDVGNFSERLYSLVLKCSRLLDQIVDFRHALILLGNVSDQRMGPWRDAYPARVEKTSTPGRTNRPCGFQELTRRAVLRRAMCAVSVARSPGPSRRCGDRYRGQFDSASDARRRRPANSSSAAMRVACRASSEPPSNPGKRSLQRATTSFSSAGMGVPVSRPCHRATAPISAAGTGASTSRPEPPAAAASAATRSASRMMRGLAKASTSA